MFSPFVSAADTTVGNELALKNAITNAPTTPYVIALSADITLSDTLEIPVNRNITLTTDGNAPWKLIGANTKNTLTVRGTLVLDGIIVTHNSNNGDTGRGVYVNSGAKLILNSGEISENDIYSNRESDATVGGGVSNGGTFIMKGGVIGKNSAYNGGGVYNWDVFEMYDGVFSENRAYGAGGGVDNSGMYSTFDMYDGLFYKNNATSGGGVANGVYSYFTLTFGVFLENSASTGGGIYNSAFEGAFIMIDGVISKNTARNNGGGVYNLGTFEMFDGVIGGATLEAGNTATNGGGVCDNGAFSKFTMHDGIISNNTANGDGGGVNSARGVFTMINGKISNNTAGYGGGVTVGFTSTFTMSSGEISGNKANDGGGIYNWGSDTSVGNAAIFIMSGGKISSNKASYGGGIYNTGIASKVTISNGEISGNSAINGGGIYNRGTAANAISINSGSKILGNTATDNGGGIFVSYANLDKVFVAAGAEFADNSAVDMYKRNPTDDALYQANIASTVTWTAPANQGYNNYDISYTNGDLLTYTVTVQDSYALNTGAGKYFVADTVTIQAGSREGYTFTEWIVTEGSITLSDSTLQTASFTMPESNVVITAQWAADEFTVTYKANGGSGVDFVDDTKYGDEYEVLDNMFTPPIGHHFDSWNLLEDGTGTSYTPGSTITIEDDVILFAQWVTDEYTVVFAPGSAGTWLAADETYTGLYYDDVMPVFGTNTGATTSGSHSFGYTFAGWSPAVPSNVPDASTGAVTVLTYTATWVQDVYPDEFSVVYKGNGFSGGVVPVDGNSPYVDGSRVVVLGQGSMVRVGYSFLGWSQSSSASTATFTAGSTFYIYEDITLYAVWSAIEYTVTYAPGTHGTFTTQTTKNLHYGDPTPTAPTVTGETGWTFTGWLPTPSTTVTTNITYTAQWKQEQTTTPTPTPSATPPTPSATPPTPTSPPSAAPSTPTPPVSTVAPTLTPTLTPAPTALPPGTGDSPQVWSVVNLVLSIAGIVLAVVVTMYVVLFKKKEAKANNTDSLSSQNRKNNKNDKDYVKVTQRRTAWLIATVVLAVVGIVVFLLTEDMSRTMAITDKWTIINVIIFIAEIITITLTFKHKKNKNQQRQQLS